MMVIPSIMGITQVYIQNISRSRWRFVMAHPGKELSTVLNKLRTCLSVQKGIASSVIYLETRWVRKALLSRRMALESNLSSTCHAVVSILTILDKLPKLVRPRISCRNVGTVYADTRFIFTFTIMYRRRGVFTQAPCDDTNSFSK